MENPMWFKTMLVAYFDWISLICICITCIPIILFIQEVHSTNIWSWEALSAVGTILAAAIALVTYRNTVNRKKNLDTIQMFSAIREKYPDLSQTNSNVISNLPLDQDRLTYLKEMERFCTGINCKLYNVRIIDIMAGKMLITQYKDYMQEEIRNRRKRSRNAHPQDLYREYERMIQKLFKLRGEKWEP